MLYNTVCGYNHGIFTIYPGATMLQKIEHNHVHALILLKNHPSRQQAQLKLSVLLIDHPKRCTENVIMLMS